LKTLLIESDFTVTLNTVVEEVEGFDEDLLLESVSDDEKAFTLKRISISDVIDYKGNPIEMTEEMIKANNDSEYIESLVNVVLTEGPDCFHPVVVQDREDNYEWIDGQHRMTALLRAGVDSTMAYIQKSS